MKRILGALIVLLILITSNLCLASSTNNNEVTEPIKLNEQTVKEFQQSIDIIFPNTQPKEGQAYAIKQIGDIFYLNQETKSITPIITFNVPQKYEGGYVEVTCGFGNQTSKQTLNAEFGKMQMQLNVEANIVAQTTMTTTVTLTKEGVESNTHSIDIQMTRYIEPKFETELHYPKTVVIDLESYSVSGKIRLIGGSLETLNNVVVMENARGEVVSAGSVKISETISYQAGMDPAIGISTLTPSEKTYSLKITFDSPMYPEGHQTIALPITATTKYTRTKLNAGLGLRLISQVESISKQQEVKIFAELKNETNSDMHGVQIFNEEGPVFTYGGIIPPNTAVVAEIHDVFEPGITRDYYAIHVDSVGGEALRAVAEIVIPRTQNVVAPEEDVEPSPTVTPTPTPQPTGEAPSTTEEPEITLVPEPTLSVGNIIENPKANNIFVRILIIIVLVIVLAVGAILLTIFYTYKKNEKV